MFDGMDNGIVSALPATTAMQGVRANLIRQYR
jgi:hypothetical protein